MACLLIFPLFSFYSFPTTTWLASCLRLGEENGEERCLSFSDIHAPCAMQMKLGSLGSEIELILSYRESFSGVSRKLPYHLGFVTFNSLTLDNVFFAFSFVYLFVCYGSFCTCALCQGSMAPAGPCLEEKSQYHPSKTALSSSMVRSCF